MTTAHMTPKEPHRADVLFGHQEAEAVLSRALTDGRMHHAWLFHGPEGIGKATLAYRLARYLFAENQQEKRDFFIKDHDQDKSGHDFYVPSTHPVFKHIAAGAQPDLCVVRPDDSAKNRQEVKIEDIRRIIAFFSLTAAQESWRVAIIDGADRCNTNAANALLKILEEPPPQSLLILTAQTPSLLPATIRSRCRKLPLGCLEKPDFKNALQQSILDDSAQESSELDFDLLYQLSEGSPGQAWHYIGNDGLSIHHLLIKMLENTHYWDNDAMHHLAERIGQAKNAQRTVRVILSRWLSDKIKNLIRIKQKPPQHWIDAYGEIETLFSDSNRLDLNTYQVILNGFLIMKNCLNHDRIT